MPGWDEASRTWWGWEFLGPRTGPWNGEMERYPEEPGLGAYQRRNIPVPVIGGLPILGGPRPPYLSWQGVPGRTRQPAFAADDGGLANGIRVAETWAAAHAFAGPDGDVLAYYLNAQFLVSFDGRWERQYSAAEAAAFGVGGPCSGLDLLQALAQRHGAGSGLTTFLRGHGYTGLAYGATSRREGRWCIFDPRIFKRLVSTLGWTPEEIERRERFDPVPIGTSTIQLEDAGGDYNR